MEDASLTSDGVSKEANRKYTLCFGETSLVLLLSNVIDEAEFVARKVKTSGQKTRLPRRPLYTALGDLVVSTLDQSYEFIHPCRREARLQSGASYGLTLGNEEGEEDL